MLLNLLPLFCEKKMVTILTLIIAQRNRRIQVNDFSLPNHIYLVNNGNDYYNKQIR